MPSMPSLFSSSPMAAREGREDRRRLWVLTSSVLLHVGVFATLAGIQAWRVEAVAEPPANDVFQVLLPAPLPAERERPAAAAKRQAEPARPAPAPPATGTPAVPPAAVQPHSADAPLPPPALKLQAEDAPQVPPASGPFDDKRGSGGPSPSGDGPGGNDRYDQNGDRGARDGSDGAPLPIGGPISRPQIVPGTKVQPIYTELARQAHLQGSVILQATIDEGGNVIDLRVLKALPMGLDREAVRAVSQWKFTPALLHGHPVKVFFTVTVQYEAR